MEGSRGCELEGSKRLGKPEPDVAGSEAGGYMLTEESKVKNRRSPLCSDHYFTTEKLNGVDVANRKKKEYTKALVSQFRNLF
ncbi:Hypothetical protein SMAX5B_021208 [Scophthalmus maximus]|uniref:Uncharacterized protein n=1 Tax=Scophthalmus maximus TaxID=52904 RepID=A0A2U9BEJ9_SCOMX|nr:Hypothetical protein SMAX5B_021208 [Scophthalmus maximus]